MEHEKKEREREDGGNWFARAIIALMGSALGTAVAIGVNRLLILMNLGNLDQLAIVPMICAYAVIAIGFGILFYFLSPAIIHSFLRLARRIEGSLSDIPMIDIVSGSVGLVIGLVIAYLLSTLIQLIPVPGLNTAISAVVYIFLGYLGWSIGRKRRSELRLPDFQKRPAKSEKAQKGEKQAAPKPKVLDTSVIIDGRIFDICKTGIVEGTLVIPGFVLQELRHVADSADGLKRNRGRRGLDILGKIQKELDIPVRVEEKDYDDIAEVDAKLLKLASDLGGVVVTNDYNLNKVAAVQGVPVLNINELANAVKPVVLPGEEMTVTVLKDGKEPGQGVAYLDDGTMIVVDGGKRFMGETVEVVVTSVLQTAAGRMIFAKLKQNS